MPASYDPHFLVYGQNRIRSFLYMDRILEFVHIRENKDTILFIYGKMRMRKSPHFGAVLHRFFYQTFDQNQPMSKNFQIQRDLRY